MFDSLSQPTVERVVRRRALTLSVFLHVAFVIVAFSRLAFTPSVSAKVVAELDVARPKIGTLYMPLAHSQAPPNAPRFPAVSAGRVAKPVLTPIPAVIESPSGNSDVDVGKLPMAFAMPNMEAPSPDVKPPQPVAAVPDSAETETPHSFSEKPAISTLKVGGRVVPAEVISKQMPVYPEAARRAGVHGAVVLSAVVSTEGRLQNIHVVSGHPLLVQAAMDCVRKWRYQPGTLNEQVIDMPITIRVNFILNYK